MTLREKIAKFPEDPGVYLFKDTRGSVLYVGKAKNLKKRTQSYVRPHARLDEAKSRMVAQATDIEFILSGTETDALLLENTLIKKYQPPFNIIFKDDKNYVYIFIPNEPFPRVLVKRMREFNPRKGSFFGPYTSARDVRYTLKTIKSIFPYRTCSLVSKKACMDYHLGRCAGTCIGAVSEAEYAGIIDSVKAFFTGHTDGVVTYLTSEMERASKDERFEAAALWRDRLETLQRALSKQTVLFKRPVEQDYLSVAKDGDMACVNLFRVRGRALSGRELFMIEHVSDLEESAILRAFSERFYGALAARPKEVILQGQAVRGQRRKLIELGIENAREHLARSNEAFVLKQKRAQEGLAQLKSALRLPAAPARIECYDISNISGTDPVGSMVVFANGLPDKSAYRKFHIRNVKGPNDVAMMQEMLRRRLSHNEWPKPDLIVVDGGKGQLNAALAVLNEAGMNIPIIGLAKREEEVFLPGKKDSLKIDPPGLYILQALRDEAHRFAITFYRKTARKRFKTPKLKK